MGEVIDHVKELKKEEGYPMLQPNLSFTRNEKVADTIMVRGDNHYCTSDWLILSTGNSHSTMKTILLCFENWMQLYDMKHF